MPPIRAHVRNTKNRTIPLQQILTNKFGITTPGRQDDQLHVKLDAALSLSDATIDTAQPLETKSSTQSYLNDGLDSVNAIHGSQTGLIDAMPTRRMPSSSMMQPALPLVRGVVKGAEDCPTKPMGDSSSDAANAKVQVDEAQHSKSETQLDSAAAGHGIVIGKVGNTGRLNKSLIQNTAHRVQDFTIKVEHHDVLNYVALDMHAQQAAKYFKQSLPLRLNQYRQSSSAQQGHSIGSCCGPPVESSSKDELFARSKPSHILDPAMESSVLKARVKLGPGQSFDGQSEDPSAVAPESTLDGPEGNKSGKNKKKKKNKKKNKKKKAQKPAPSPIVLDNGLYNLKPTIDADGNATSNAQSRSAPTTPVSLTFQEWRRLPTDQRYAPLKIKEKLAILAIEAIPDILMKNDKSQANHHHDTEISVASPRNIPMIDRMAFHFARSMALARNIADNGDFNLSNASTSASTSDAETINPSCAATAVDRQNVMSSLEVEAFTFGMQEVSDPGRGGRVVMRRYWRITSGFKESDGIGGVIATANKIRRSEKPVKLSLEQKSYEEAARERDVDGVLICEVEVDKHGCLVVGEWNARALEMWEEKDDVFGPGSGILLG